MKATLSDAKARIDVTQLGLRSCDAAFVNLLNDATQELMTGGENWWNLTQKMAITAYGGCVTWPRAVANISAIAVGNRPVTSRSIWFEYLESGYGLRCCNPCEHQMFDRGTAVTFRAIRHGYTIRVFTEENESSGLEMGFLGYDCQGNWIRTQDSTGAWRDGLWVPVPTSPSTPYTGQIQFALDGITEIIKPQTNSLVHLYDYNLTTADGQKIGVYEHDETRPVYRKSLIGGIPQEGSCTVNVIYKQEYKPVVNDNDFLLIANIPALSEMMLAIKLRRQNQMQLSAGHEGKAFQLLDREVSHYLGNGMVEPVRIDYRDFGAGGVLNLY